MWLTRSAFSPAWQALSHAGKAATRTGLGMFNVPLPRAVPAGMLPTKMMSLGIEIRVELPSPTFHSPKAIVLLVPSVTERMLVGGPLLPSVLR